jgi:hypothetical protein
VAPLLQGIEYMPKEIVVTAAGMWKWAKAALMVMVTLMALFGGYTGYHFYLAPTGLTDTKTGQSYHRAQLIDFMIADMVDKQRAQGK